MIETETFEYTVRDPVGLHARPAGLLVRKAQEYASDVTVTCKGGSANLKKLLAVMGLGIRRGDTVTITVTGENAAAQATELKRFFEETV